jgi:type II secretory pathway predicted ATPase ExeA
MFLEYYKLRDQPFGVTPDPRFLYFGPAHREALASLVYSIETKRGFSAMVAEPGMGKTTLLFRLMEMLRGSSRTAFLFQTEGDSRDLLRSILNDLGIATQGQDLSAMYEALNSALLEEMRAGRQVVVILDEAQNLDEKSLESVRLLSNFETSTQKLMHIVLAGQPKLGEKLTADGLKQLRQRVSTIIRLEPFGPEETKEYIQWRLRAAGYEGPELFSSKAFGLIARASKGIPRNINNLCFQALSIGFATQAKVIGSEILREVVSDLDSVEKSSYRVSAEAPADQPEADLVDSSMPTTPVWDTWAYVPPSPEHSSNRIKGIGVLACITIPLLLIFILSDPKLGLTRTPPGRVSGQVVNAVLNSGDPSSDFVPALPRGLKPPTAPTVEPTPALPTAPLPNQSSPEGDDSDHYAQPSEDPTQAQAGIGLAAKKNGEISGDQEGGDHSRNEVRRKSSLVQVSHRENLFEFALENYGKSSREVVDDICRLNPQVGGPFEMLSAGQWIQLPSDVSALTAATEPRSTNVDTADR